MQPHEAAQAIGVSGGEPHPQGDRPDEPHAALGVIAGVALADVVEEGGDDQQVGAIHLSEQTARLDRGLDEVPVHGVAVEGVALRAALHRSPLGDQHRPDAGVVQLLEHGDEPLAGAQEGEEVLPRRGRPWIGQRPRPIGAVAEAASMERQARGGGGDGAVEDDRQDVAVIPAGQDDLVVGAHDASTELAGACSTPSPCRTVDPGPDAPPAVVTDPRDAAPGGGHTGHEHVAVTQAETATDLVLLLQQQAVGGPPGGPVQLHTGGE